MKKISVLIIFLIFIITGCTTNKQNNNFKITVTSFPCYDITKAIVKENAEVDMLIKPGTEVHSYEPTPQDIINISKSDIFIYIGGASDEWVDNVLESVDNKDLKVIKLIDYVDVLDDSDHDHHHDVDEHIWTNPLNMIKMTNIIKETVVEIDSKNSNMYEENATKYINEINVLHEEFKNVISNAKRKTIVFADRFPFKYFALEYGIDYKAAYNSCSSESEVSAKTLSELIDYVNDNNIPAVFYLELSNQNIANTIQNETDCDKKLFHSGQNVTSEEFKNGITLLEIMENNLENLKGALN